MHLRVEVKSLQAGLATVIKSLSSRPSLPILEGIYICATPEGLLLRCSDLTLQIDSILPAEIEEEGAVVLPGRLFSEMARKLDGDMVEISLDDKAVVLRAGRSNMRLQYMEAREFPDMVDGRDAVHLSMEQSKLKDMIRQSAFATAQEETKPILTGVLCELEGNAFNMVALDGFRLAMRKAILDQYYTRMEAVVPAKSLVEISRTLLDTEDPVQISFSKTHLSLDLGYTKIISRLLDGEYIKYQAILPSEHKTRVLVNRLELLESIDRAILLAREGNNNLVRFTVEGEFIQLFANSALGRMDENIPITLNGEPVQIAFNARYFSDVLKALQDEDIYLDMNNNVSPCVIRPVQGDSYYYLILPVRIFS